MESDSAADGAFAGKPERHHLSRLDRGRAGREPGLTSGYEPLRSPHSFAFQRALRRMALSPLRFSRQLQRPARAASPASRTRDGFCHHYRPRHDRRQLGDRRSRGHVHQRRGNHLLSPRPVQDSPVGLGNFGNAACRYRPAARQHFRSAKLSAAAGDRAFGRASTLQHQWKTGGVAPRTAAPALQTFRGNQWPARRTPEPAGARTSFRSDAGKNRGDGEPPRFATDASGAVAENFYRRLGRSRRPIRGRRLHRNSKGEDGG